MKHKPKKYEKLLMNYMWHINIMQLTFSECPLSALWMVSTVNVKLEKYGHYKEKAWES